MAVRPLAGSIAASVALHAAAAAWLEPGAHGDERQSSPARAPLIVSLASALPRSISAPPSRAGERGRAGLAAIADPSLYYTAKQVDLKATPMRMKTSVRTPDNFP